MCARCKGKGLCGKPCRILNKIEGYSPKVKLHFSGSSPPEIFVGRHNYPDINAGILSPEEHGEKEDISLPEIWHQKNYSIPEILSRRASLIYSRFKTAIKGSSNNRFKGVMQEVSMADKSVSMEVFLKKAPKQKINFNQEVPLIGNPAPLKSIALEENPKILKKVDYLVSDNDAKATTAMEELYKGNIRISNISKILSAGLLGIGYQRKLVPTRWAITAVDDTLSKNLLKKIRYYPEISEILVFTSEYLGNHYEIILLPDKFSFEVIEAKMHGSVWNPFSSETIFMKDYEGFFGRKNYASNVTGAYYANRLALCEYFDKIKRQASCLVMREARPEYYAPMGVGILREASRQAFKNLPEKFSSLKEAIEKIKTRMKIPPDEFINRSILLKKHGKQKRLTDFL
jgi:hypothetical protein